jgi:hypothetical protein
MRIDIKKEIEDNQIIVFVISNELYIERLISLIKILTKMGKILYVTINKPYSTLMDNFQKNAIPKDQFFFIDAITRTVKKPEPIKNVEFISSPSALTELSLSISTTLEKQKFYSVLFDSLSTLLIYQEPLMVIKFAHSAISMLRTAGVKVILTVLSGDISSDLIKDLNMFADKVVDTSKGSVVW